MCERPTQHLVYREKKDDSFDEIFAKIHCTTHHKPTDTDTTDTCSGYNQTHAHVWQSKYHNNVDTLTPHHHPHSRFHHLTLCNQESQILPFPISSVLIFANRRCPQLWKLLSPSWFSSLPWSARPLMRLLVRRQNAVQWLAFVVISLSPLPPPACI